MEEFITYRGVPTDKKEKPPKRDYIYNFSLNISKICLFNFQKISKKVSSNTCVNTCSQLLRSLSKDFWKVFFISASSNISQQPWRKFTG